ncbi:deoxyhypusine hydroxylase-like [Saccoglossus kowalevskii]|uniref:Deoxyhypusine hydroxylase n=1 Tax=Saccoglossus kowalevskii TaxID=10224 RepID=A0ABM0H200_SACKO|nr:PREDICTED: deoxyhypusine hydroxylase-like [Saccoglossus kowalevskii]
MAEHITVEKMQQMLCNKELSMRERFRGMSTLRDIGGKEAIDSLLTCLDDPSALLKHEAVFCIGQIQDPYAIPYLINVLEDTSQEPIVRHEAAEALGAIGSKEVLNILEKYRFDPVIEIAETCQLALARINWLNTNKHIQVENPYKSVDPAPASDDDNVESLKSTLLDESLPLFDRYRAMFALRNKTSEESVLALAEGMKASSILLRHELAFILGQMRNKAGDALGRKADDTIVTVLTDALKNSTESSVVRHECATALGEMDKNDCMQVLKEYLHDEEAVVSESCQLSLDMYAQSLLSK